MNITVISPCCQRFENYENVLKGWLSQPEVNEVIVLDNSGSFTTDLPVLTVSVSQNLGPQAKYSLALWAKNEVVCFADDDILVEEGLASDLLRYWGKDKVVGILGRNFTGEGYYDSTAYWGADLTEPQKVDWLGGGCTLTHRDNCAVNMRECPSMTLDDLWWESHIRDRVGFYVVPTKKYQFLPENWDGGALHHHEDIKPLRERYVKEWGFKK